MGHQSLSMEELRLSIKETIYEWYGIPISESAIDLILADPTTKNELFDEGFHPGDTETRTVMMRVLTNKAEVRDWPVIGENFSDLALERYVDDLAERLFKMGLVVPYTKIDKYSRVEDVEHLEDVPNVKFQPE